MRFPFLVVVLLLNLWLWRILSINLFLGLILISITLCLSVLLVKPNKKLTGILAILGVLLLILQWTTTKNASLINLSNDQIRVRDMRLREYPPIYFLPIAHWFEGRPESIAFFRLLDNFSEAVDPNLYFFANHPRERVGVKEFEKFPYLFLPAFLIGILILAEKKKKVFLLSLLLPFTVLTLKGSDNPLGPFTLFPAVSVAIAAGMKFFYDGLGKKRVIILIALILILAVFVQTLAYDRF